ncbi:MAG: ClpX C4-type zinc finger protein [Gammaproteobacteria bacterium]|nr:ClpX C4-type zinc finger protein [Gammaproteobacteria bacterium]MDH5629201.1 ClpX C4-type zinc finger protein [Gammaproteobacteria bacterium]
MKKQLHIKYNSQESVFIDVNDDESITISLDTPPAKLLKEKGKIPKTLFRVEGSRWRDDEYFYLNWLEKEVLLDDIIMIQFKEDDRKATPLTKVEKYIEPEKECTFCDKKASEVKHLVEKDFMARICDECVKLSQQVIDEKIQSSK